MRASNNFCINYFTLKIMNNPLIFFQNKAASELDEVYKSNMYDGGLSKGGKLTLPPAQQIAKDDDA